MQPHPETGRKYLAVIPHAWGPFADIRACYAKLADERPWLAVLDPDDFSVALEEMRDESALFVHWAPSALRPEGLPADRRALVVPVYSEAMDSDESILLPDHRRDWDDFLTLTSSLDGFFAHTPWMVDQISSSVSIPGFVLPVGWHPVMGEPDWDGPKEIEAVFAGSILGRREELIPMLEERVSLQVCRGIYGPALIDVMNKAKASLYVAHSSVQSYSTWRIWQSMCSSAALLTEPGDWWPLAPALCFPLPTITPSNIDEVARSILELSHSHALDRARALHETLRPFTTRFCVDRYIVDATVSLTR